MGASVASVRPPASWRNVPTGFAIQFMTLPPGFRTVYPPFQQRLPRRDFKSSFTVMAYTRPLIDDAHNLPIAGLTHFRLQCPHVRPKAPALYKACRKLSGAELCQLVQLFAIPQAAQRCRFLAAPCHGCGSAVRLTANRRTDPGPI